MDNKGFAISGILYTVFIIFMVSITMMLFNLQNRKTILDELKADAASAVESDNNYEYLLNEINTLKTQLNIDKTYSTEEQVVGTWIDGKDIYRKTLVLETSEENSTSRNLDFTSTDANSENAFITYVQSFDLAELNIDTIISKSGIALSDNNNSYLPFPVTYQACALITGWYNISEKKYYVRYGEQYYSRGGVLLYLTLEYTKNS